MKQQDCLRRFLFEEHNIRGEWVSLRDSWQQAKQHQRLVNDAVEAQLGQALAAVVLLSATIKFKGSMIMQIQGAGDLKALVAQSSNDRNIRGLVRSNASVAGDNLKQMLGGTGRLVLTVESEHAEQFQGIVGVVDNSLAEVIAAYFRQSEQLETRLWLFADKTHAVGLFLQQMPGDSDDSDDWRRVEMLADTVTAEEMLSLDCEELLHRLFHEEKVRLFDPEPVEFQCACSRQKIAGTLSALGRSELEEILLERQDIEVDCQFCGAQYRFDRIDVESLLATPPLDTQPSPTRH